MKVSQLLELLEGKDLDAEVRIATQPSYPIRHYVRDVVLGAEAIEDIDETDPDEVKDGAIVWLVAGEGISHGESPYASRDLWNR